MQRSSPGARVSRNARAVDAGRKPGRAEAWPGRNPADDLRAPRRVEGVLEGGVLLPAVAYRCRIAGMADSGSEPRPRRTGRRVRARRTRRDPDGRKRCDRQKRSYTSLHLITPLFGACAVYGSGVSRSGCRPAVGADTLRFPVLRQLQPDRAVTRVEGARPGAPAAARRVTRSGAIATRQMQQLGSGREQPLRGHALRQSAGLGSTSSIVTRTLANSKWLRR
jgi:hypothetical protein